MTHLLRLPGDLLSAIPRVAADVAAIRVLLEEEVVRTNADLDLLKAEIIQVRLQVDEVAQTLPGDNDPGPLERAKSALLPGSG